MKQVKTGDALKKISPHKNSQQFPKRFSQNIGKLPKYWEGLCEENLRNVKA
jgi:hypothetical protein